MLKIGRGGRYVISRENNVVVVDFRVPDPPAPKFPGAGALRGERELGGGSGGSCAGPPAASVIAAGKGLQRLASQN